MRINLFAAQYKLSPHEVRQWEPQDFHLIGAAYRQIEKMKKIPKAIAVEPCFLEE